MGQPYWELERDILPPVPVPSSVIPVAVSKNYIQLYEHQMEQLVSVKTKTINELFKPLSQPKSEHNKYGKPLFVRSILQKYKKKDKISLFLVFRVKKVIMSNSFLV